MKTLTAIFILTFLLFYVNTAAALNPDKTCPVNDPCTLNFILLNTTGYQVGNAPCSYLLLKAFDLSLDSSGNMSIVASGGNTYYQLVHTFTIENTYSMRINCDLVEGVPAYFMQNIISSNYLNISVIPVNVSINLTEPSNNATLVVGSCPANTGASAMLWLVFAFALTFIALGIFFKIGLIGVFGSLILGVGSWYIYGCAPILGYIIGAASVISVAYFILIGWII